MKITFSQIKEFAIYVHVECRDCVGADNWNVEGVGSVYWRVVLKNIGIPKFELLVHDEVRLASLGSDK